MSSLQRQSVAWIPEELSDIHVKTMLMPSASTTLAARLEELGVLYSFPPGPSRYQKNSTLAIATTTQEIRGAAVKVFSSTFNSSGANMAAIQGEVPTGPALAIGQCLVTVALVVDGQQELVPAGLPPHLEAVPRASASP